MSKLITKILLLSLLIGLQSCAGLGNLDKAQDVFNKGANLENKGAFNMENFNSISPTSYYNIAYREVNEALNKKAKLRKDSLLANAYALKALCEWKLKRYELALESAEEALDIMDGYKKAGLLLPRDEAIMDAIGGLVLSDQANDTIVSKKKLEDFNIADAEGLFTTYIFKKGDEEGGLETAMDIYDAALKNVSNVEAMKFYFLMCKLSTLKVMSDGRDFLTNAKQVNRASLNQTDLARIQDLLDDSKELYDDLGKDLRGELLNLLGDDQQHPTFQYWRKTLVWPNPSGRG